MTPVSFCSSLTALARARGLTASDLAIWFGRPRVTVRTWLDGTKHPKAHPRDDFAFQELCRRLALLEESRAFPVPYETSLRDRPAYIKRAYVDGNQGVSRSHSPGARTVLPRRVRNGSKRAEGQ